jgi:membrane protease YdiL (CAAX protease family)
MRFVWPVVAALLWALGIFVVAVLLCVPFGIAHAGKPVLKTVAVLALEFGGTAYLFLLCFGRLPWVGGRSAEYRGLGWLGGLGAVAAFFAMQIAGALGVTLMSQIVDVARVPGHLLPTKGPADLVFLATCAGETAAGLWLVWRLRRLGAARLHDAGPTGIAWLPASARAYGVAAAGAAAVCLVALGSMYVVPPDMSALKNTSMAALFEGPAWTLPPLFAIAILGGPILEELAFRGVAFAGLAARLGPGWAVLITSALFVAAHTPEKIHYPLGFVDVGLMALGSCWLRLRFGSIRPGMLMHILYNGGAFLVLGAFASMHGMKG